MRSVFFNSYAADPRGALSWRFKRDLAGSGALGDLLSHVVDLMQYVVAPIAQVSSLLSTVHAQRPILPMGSATHFAVIEDGELGDVENDDYVAALVRFAAARDGRRRRHAGSIPGHRGPGVRARLRDLRHRRLGDLELRADERAAALPGYGGASHGYTTILGNASQGDYAHFQPGPGTSMSYDDLKVIEAKKFLVAMGGGEQLNSTIEEAHADAEVIAATAASARDGAWHSVTAVAGATFGHGGA